MSVTFTVRGPSSETVSEFYYHFYRSLRRTVEGGPDLELLHQTDDGCERSFALNNAGSAQLKAACDTTEARGCQVVSPAEYTIPVQIEPEVVALEEPADPAPEEVPEVVAAPKKRRGRPSK